MKHIYLFLVVISFACYKLPAQHISCNEYEQTKQEIINEIHEISRVLGPRLNPRDRQFLEHRLNEIAEKLNYLTDQSYTVYTISPIPEAEFNLVLRMVEKESFDNDKVKIINTAMSKEYLMISQLGLLLERISFEDNRIEVINYLYPNVIDKENSDMLFDYITFSNSKDKLKHIIMQDMNQRHPD